MVGAVLVYAAWCGDLEPYARMARVLEHTARVRMPHATVRVEHLPDAIRSRSDAFVVKARAWSDVIMRAHDGEELLLLDVDMLVLDDGSSGFSAVSEIGVTTRGGLTTLNSGVLYVRVSQRVREWIAPWEERTREWCARNATTVRYGDQDAMISMCRDGGVDVAELPCARYNAQQNCWPPSDDCALVHVKSDARRILFGGRLHGNHGAAVVADLWRAAERAALSARQ